MEEEDKIHSDFLEWKSSDLGNDWIKIESFDPSESKLTLAFIACEDETCEKEEDPLVAEVAELLLPGDDPDSVWFIERKCKMIRNSSTGIECCPWANDLNAYFVLQSNLSLGDVLTKISSIVYPQLQRQFDRKSKDKGKLSGIEQHDFDEDDLLSSEEEFDQMLFYEGDNFDYKDDGDMVQHLNAYGIIEEVASCQEILGEDMIFLIEQLGEVNLVIPIEVPDALNDILQLKKKTITVQLDFSPESIPRTNDPRKEQESRNYFPLPKFEIFVGMKTDQTDESTDGTVKKEFGERFYLPELVRQFLIGTWGANNVEHSKSKSNSGFEFGKFLSSMIMSPLSRSESKNNLKRSQINNTFVGNLLECNFFLGLHNFVRKVLLHFDSYCLMCISKHTCKTNKPVVCSKTICAFRFEDLMQQDSIVIEDWWKKGCTICPYDKCNEQLDTQQVLKTLKLEKSDIEQMGVVKEKMLVQMYKHKYLPNSDIKNLLSDSTWKSVKVISIEPVLNPALVLRFERKRKEMGKWRNSTSMAFHGTYDSYINSILSKGLLVPGKDDNGISHKCDTGWWGGGIYLSPRPSVSMGYNGGTRRLIVCSVLMGKRYMCKKRMDGKPLKKGYDSHVSPRWSASGNWGQEWILFDEAQVLPCYVINC